MRRLIREMMMKEKVKPVLPALNNDLREENMLPVLPARENDSREENKASCLPALTKDSPTYKDYRTELHELLKPFFMNGRGSVERRQKVDVFGRQSYSATMWLFVRHVNEWTSGLCVHDDMANIDAGLVFATFDWKNAFLFVAGFSEQCCDESRASVKEEYLLSVLFWRYGLDSDEAKKALAGLFCEKSDCSFCNDRRLYGL